MKMKRMNHLKHRIRHKTPLSHLLDTVSKLLRALTGPIIKLRPSSVVLEAAPPD